MRVFTVYEVDWPTRYIIGCDEGTFSNFESAEKYVQEKYTPHYDRYLVIVEHTIIKSWPYDLIDHQPNVLTYFRQANGGFERIEDD